MTECELFKSEPNICFSSMFQLKIELGQIKYD